MSDVEREAFPCPPSLMQEAEYSRLWLKEGRCYPLHQVGRARAAQDWAHWQQNCDWHFDLNDLKSFW